VAIAPFSTNASERIWRPPTLVQYSAFASIAMPAGVPWRVASTVGVPPTAGIFATSPPRLVQ
jgi:hypothetical protein